MVFLKLQLEAWGYSGVMTGIAGNLSCCLREIKSAFELWGQAQVALESHQGNWVSSGIEGGISWCFSSCGQKIWVHLELQLEPHGTSNVASGKSAFLSSCEGHLGISLELLQGNRSSSPV